MDTFGNAPQSSHTGGGSMRLRGFHITDRLMEQSCNSVTDIAYELAASRMEPANTSILERLNHLDDGEVMVCARSYDPVSMLVARLGVRAVQVEKLADITDPPKVLMLGCQPDAHRSVVHDLRRLAAGGVTIVSSDRTARLPLLRRVIRPQRPQPSRWARVRLTGSDIQRIISPSVNSDLSLLPAVRLSPGHVPIHRDVLRDDTVRVIAVDALTGDPLALVARIGRGAVIHSAAHWWQDVEDSATELERLPLSAVAGLHGMAGAGPSVPFGRYASASTILVMLAVGLEWAMDDCVHRLAESTIEHRCDSRENEARDVEAA